jgi:hypothetical protein
LEVSAQINKGDNAGKSVTVQAPLLDSPDLKTLVENFGETEVYEHARRSFVVSLQSFLRTQIDAGKTDEAIQEAALEWRPGQKRATKSPSERIADLMSKMSPAEREALLKEYKVVTD